MALTNDELRQIGDMFENTLKKIVKGTSAGQGRGTTRRSSKDVTRDLERDFAKASKKTTGRMEDLGKLLGRFMETAKSQSAYKRILDRINRNLKQTDEAYELLEKEVNILGRKTYQQQRDYLNRYSQSIKNLTTVMGKNIRASSLLASATLKSHEHIEAGTNEYYEMIKELGEVSKPLNRGILKAAGAWDDATKSVKEGLPPETFANLRLMIGETQTILAETLGKLGPGFESFEQILGKGEGAINELLKAENQTTAAAKAFKDQMIKAGVALALQGHDVGVNLVNTDKNTGARSVNASALEHLSSDAGSGDILKLIKKSASIQKDASAFNANADRVAGLASSAFGKTVLSARSDVKEALSGKAGLVNVLKKGASGLLAAAGGAGGAKGVWGAFKDIIGQLAEFNIQNVPKSFLATQVASVKLGMSFDDTVKFMQANKSAMAIYGDDFDSEVSKQAATFRKFGFNMEQAAASFAPLREAAIAAGVVVRNGDKLNDFIDSSMKSFQKLAAITDVTAEQFFQLKGRLLSSSDMQNTLLGLDQAAAQAKAEEIIASHRAYVQQGLSLEQAEELVKLQQKQQRDTVLSRVKEGAKAMMFAAQAGLGTEDQMRVFQLSRKGRRSEAENAELQALLGQAGAASEQRQAAAYAQSESAGELQQTIFERLSPEGLVGEMIDKGKDLAVKERAGAGITDAEAKKSEEAAKGSEAVAGISQTLNQVSSFLSNKFGAALLGGTASMIGLTVSAISASRSLMMLGKGGLLGQAAGAAGKGGLLSRAGGALAGAGRSIGSFMTGGAATGAAKVAAPLAALAAVGQGAFAEGTTGNIKSVGEVVPTGWNKLNPFAWAMNAGRGVGAVGNAGYGAASNLVGGSGSLGSDIYSWFHKDYDPNDDVTPEQRARWKAMREARLAREAAKSQPAPAAMPPSIAQAQAAAGVNTSEAATTEADKTVVVEDETAHGYLATMATNLGQAVALLTAITQQGDEAAAAEIVARLKGGGSKQVPTANSYVTGRQSTP